MLTLYRGKLNGLYEANQIHKLGETPSLGVEGFGCVFIYFYISPGCIHSPIVRAALGSNVDQRAKDFSITPKKK